MELRIQLATVGVLWRREVRLFFRQRSRVIGALAPPLLLWLAIGAGIAPRFSLGNGEVNYLEYLYPGILMMLLLQVSISTTMSVIEDRREGFLQGVLVAPGSRGSMVLGKSLGAASVAVLHGLMFLVLAPWAGFPLGNIAWPTLLAALLSLALALTLTGFVIAWWLNSVQGYHVVMSLALFPLWIVSGAMFPTDGLHAVLRPVVQFNPLTYGMAAIR
ncbi:MAG: ABC transporter permease, partial [Acidobacteriota bacterium]|nr:ABC transporter permease [Acidobacteriota bacterium]